MAGTLTKLAGVELATVVDRAALSPEARRRCTVARKSAEAIARLEAAGFAAEAVRVLAHALPKREGGLVGLHVRRQHRAGRPAGTRPAGARTAEQWVRQQKDEQRRAAMKQAEASGFQIARGLGGASRRSGAAIRCRREVCPPFRRRPTRPARAVAGAVALAAVRGDVKRQAGRLKRFLESGRNIAAGGPGRMPPEEA